MKYKISIIQNEKTIFDGKPLELPIKKEMLIKKSIEMFNDEDPCIIHQTYVIETLVDQLISKLKPNLNQSVEISSVLPEIDFIDIKNLEGSKIILRSK
jgi:hypothetical protein